MIEINSRTEDIGASVNALATKGLSAGKYSLDLIEAKKEIKVGI
jgi:hypothetical protein